MELALSTRRYYIWVDLLLFLKNKKKCSSCCHGERDWGLFSQYVELRTGEEKRASGVFRLLLLLLLYFGGGTKAPGT